MQSFSAPPPAYITLPLWATRILAIVLPVWAAWQGKLTVFEVVWVYWVEGWLIIPFLMLRIAASRGWHTDSGLPAILPPAGDAEQTRTTAWQRLRMMAGLLFMRGLLLMFYLVFIVLFLLLQVTQEEAMEHGIETIVFRNPWANSAWAAFVVAQVVEIATHFFGNGAWRTASPRNWLSVFDHRTILLHIVIVSTVMLHKFCFEGSDYATRGEVAYVALFGLLRLGIDGLFNRFSPLQPRTESEAPAGLNS